MNSSLAESPGVLARLDGKRAGGGDHPLAAGNRLLEQRGRYVVPVNGLKTGKAEFVGAMRRIAGTSFPSQEISQSRYRSSPLRSGGDDTLHPLLRGSRDMSRRRRDLTKASLPRHAFTKVAYPARQGNHWSQIKVIHRALVQKGPFYAVSAVKQQCRIEINNAPETGDQVGMVRFQPVDRKIRKSGISPGIRMGQKEVLQRR